MNFNAAFPSAFTPTISPPPVLHRFSIDVYHRMGEARVFARGDHVELIRGLVVDRFPGGTPHRFSVEQYDRMIETGILGKNDKVELIEGLIVEKYAVEPAHHYTVYELIAILSNIAGPSGWFVRPQGAVTLSNGEPEPDISVVRGRNADYKVRNPGPADVVLVVEVADTSLELDRQVKLRIYAAAGIPEYWIVNLRDRQVETHRDPRPATESSEATFNSGETIPATDKLLLTLDDRGCGEIAVGSILP
jgi:Uma2 family endonuclease